MQKKILKHNPSVIDHTLYRLTADDGMMLCNINVYLDTVDTFDPDVWFEVLKDVANVSAKAQETDYLAALDRLGVTSDDET